MNQFREIMDDMIEKAGWDDDSCIYLLCEYINSCMVEGIFPYPDDFRQYMETQYADESKMTT